MKSVTIFIIVVLFTSLNMAQQKKALVSIGGEIGYSYSSDLEDIAYGPLENITSRYLINPSIGYFLTNNIELGIGLGFSHTTNETKGENADSENKQNIFSISPFGRYYNYFNEDLGLFLELNLLYGFGNSENVYRSVTKTNNDVTNYSVKLNPGLFYYISNTILISASINVLDYQKTKYKLQGSSTSIPETREVFHLGVDFKTVNLGIRIII